MKRRQLCWGTSAFACMVLLILDSKTALSGARNGIDLCVRCLIPSIFPFMVLSSVLTDALLGASIPAFHPFKRLFCLPDGYESLLIPSFLGGYPAGAQCIGEFYRQGKISVSCANQLLLFCNNAGPSFLFGILGAIFPERKMLWLLWGIHIFAAVLFARLFPVTQNPLQPVSHNEPSITRIVSNSIKAMGGICGWVVLFRIMISYIDHWLLWIFPPPTQVWIKGTLELSNGCYALSEIDDVRLRFVICSCMLSFGGICITMQTASVIGSLPIFPYLGGKLLQTLFSLFLSIALVYHTTIPLFLLILLVVLLKKVVALRKSLVYNSSINQRRTQYAVSKKNRPCL